MKLRKRKYKILFCGDLTQNNGPANVNKSLRKYSSYVFIDTKRRNKIKMIFRYIINLFSCDLVIFSCNYRVNYYLFRFAKLFGKKTLYLMHGYSKFEATENNIANIDKIIKREEIVLKKTNLIITVSSAYKKELDNYIPMYSNKIHYITNGIEKSDYNFDNSIQNQNISNNRIIVCGGNRITKCNSFVSKAVNSLNQMNYECYLDIYGLLYEKNEELIESDFVKICGRVSQNELFEELRKSKLFVLNCKVESFGLSVIDALMCGCNILISERAGITSILKLEETDIIHNFNDIQELSEKIRYNLKFNNNERIKKSIDFEHYSWSSVANRLEKITNSFLDGEEYKNII